MLQKENWSSASLKFYHISCHPFCQAVKKGSEVKAAAKKEESWGGAYWGQNKRAVKTTAATQLTSQLSFCSQCQKHIVVFLVELSQGKGIVGEHRG